MELLTVAVFVAMLLIVLYIYVQLIKGKCTSKADLTGKTAVITGANTGIGLCTAIDLARRNCRVIMACRNMERGEEAKSTVVKETGNMNVVLMHIDLSSMKSVREFALRLLKEEKRLDILINNAGMLGLPRTITSEGLELTMASNHLGPFLLTNLLLDLLIQSAPSRIIVLTSVVNIFAKMDFDNFFFEKSWNIARAYNTTKLANILFTKELSRKLEGKGVTVNCLHPGVVRTELLRSIPTLWRFILKMIGLLYFKSSEEGAQTTIYCAVSEELNGVSGRYFIDCRDYENTMYINKLSYDEGLAKKLWEISEKLTELSPGK